MHNNYFFQEVVIKNPVLVGIIGLCPVVAICTTLKSALIMSLITILTLVIAQALSSLVFRHLPQWLRLGLYALVGMAVVVPFILVIEKVSPSSMLAFGIYLPLLAINPIITRQCEREGVTPEFGKTILNALCAGAGYSLVLIIVGFLRELLGSGAILGKRIIPISPASVFLMPAGGFIILAYLAAALRLYFKKIDPEYAEELAINSRSSIKKSRTLKATLLGEDEPLEEVFEGEELIKPELKAKKKGIEKRKSSKKKTEDKKAESKKIESRKAEKRKAEDKKDESSKSENKKTEIKKNEVEDTEVQNDVPLETTIKAELSNTAPLPSNAKVTRRTEKFEFITLDLSASEKSKEEAEAFKAAVEKSKEKKPQKQRTKRNQAKKVRETSPEKKDNSSIVYKSDELEKLMAMSLDDIIDTLPEKDTLPEDTLSGKQDDKEEGNKE